MVFIRLALKSSPWRRSLKPDYRFINKRFKEISRISFLNCTINIASKRGALLHLICSISSKFSCNSSLFSLMNTSLETWGLQTSSAERIPAMSSHLNRAVITWNLNRWISCLCNCICGLSGLSLYRVRFPGRLVLCFVLVFSNNPKTCTCSRPAQLLIQEIKYPILVKSSLTING